MKRLSPHEHFLISFAVHINLSSIFIRQPGKNLIGWFSIMEQKLGINFGCWVACNFCKILGSLKNIHGQSAQDEANFASRPCNSIDKVEVVIRKGGVRDYAIWRWQFGDFASGLGKVVKWMWNVDLAFCRDGLGKIGKINLEKIRKINLAK
jgi:hypothetical protein